MASASQQLVVAFPIATTAFGFREDWFTSFAPKFIQPSYLLMTLFLVISVGLMALKGFENAHFEKKAWNIPILILIVGFWPALVLALKDLVDVFNTFLITNVFNIPWRGFGFPEMGTLSGIMGWPAEGLARLLPNLAYWIIYAFYLVFFFFYAILGPLILAKGILGDEIENFLTLVKELVVLFLWQTTLVILVAFIMPDIVSGKQFPQDASNSVYFLSIILAVMIFFIPSLSRKFGGHLESAFVPTGFRWGGAALGLSLFGKATAPIMTSLGASAKAPAALGHWRHQLLEADEFAARWKHQTHIQDLEAEKDHLEEKLQHGDGGHEDEGHGDEGHDEDHSMVHLSKEAKKEMGGNEEH